MNYDNTEEQQMVMNYNPWKFQSESFREQEFGRYDSYDQPYN